jgi:hypothetical protein
MSPEMFASRAALWVAQSFEPLLAWTNAHFQATQWLWLYRCGGVTLAALKPLEERPANETVADLVYACPVVRGTPSNTSGA